MLDSWAESPVLYDSVRIGLWAAAKSLFRIGDHPIGEQWALLDELENNRRCLTMSEMLNLTDQFVCLAIVADRACTPDHEEKLKEAQEPDRYQQMFEEEVSCFGRVPMKSECRLRFH
jgi:hypothetical protein